MQSVKKYVFVAVMAMLAAMAANVPAHAESEHRIAVNIPFDFVVGNSVLKAGGYKVEKLESGVLDFYSTEGRRHHFMLAVEGTPLAGHKDNPYLVFTRYGNEAFLSKISLSVDNSFEFLQSEREKEVIGSQAAGEQSALIVQPAR